MKRAAVAGLLTVMSLGAQEFTRGVGVYPGNPAEDFSPVLRTDSAYRNLALRRPAWHSSAYDYNLTAQLVTDGIKETAAPRWVAVSTSQHGVLKKNQREWLLDDNWVSTVDLKGKHAWIQFELGGEAPAVDRLRIDGSVRAAESDNQDWACTVMGSEDGKSWVKLGVAAGMAKPTGEIHGAVELEGAGRRRYYRLQFDAGRPLLWQIGEVSFWNAGARVHVGGPYEFSSTWMSAGGGEQWVSVDLGAKCRFDRVALAWIRRAPEGAVQVSDDNSKWRTVAALGAGGEMKVSGEGRYVRVLMTGPATAEGYALSELEVYGTGGMAAAPQPAAAMKGNRLDIAGGGWKVQRDVKADGAALSRTGYPDSDWVAATVPGTVLASYYNAGAVPDPNYGDNQLMISDSFFYADFWYRTEFEAPPAAVPGKKAWLNFDGINWKAEVYLNGEKLGRIEGAFTRARFDVTERLKSRNALAVLVLKNATPGSVKEKTYENPDKNGGALGADNPTYHASIGWDWIPTIRGRNTGIWNDVYLTVTGPVTLENPQVTTALPLPDTSRAEVSLAVTLRNHSAAPVSGTLRGRFGDVPFEQAVRLEASEATLVKVNPLRLEKPRLWWPAGYGEPNLYPVEVSFEGSDSKSFRAGVRQFTYSEDGGALRMWINGRRFIPKGGNWGFGESMLRYRGREYDAAVRYHADMHFNMIRNWVGQIGDDEFYEACDRHGIVVWQDFWLANPWDGPEPDDNGMFMRNVEDTILRIRNHPSVGLYCGRNEGYPLKPLDDAIRAALAEKHPGIHYIGSSADDVVTGHGPYRAMSFEYYFSERAATKFHSEMGMPNIVTMDSLEAMMPRAAMWPQSAMWGLHDFCLGGAQGGSSYLERIKNSYGGAKSIEEWVSLAQFVNYEGHRAMFEAQSKNRMGLLMWMSHPTWPSFVWQTYDYYLEPTAAYFGSKKGAEPLHVQWNPVNESVEVVNYSGGDLTGLTVRAQVVNLDGTVKWTRSATVDSKEDSTVSPIKMQYPADVSAVHFLRLSLVRNGTAISENFYWRGVKANDFRALRELGQAPVAAETKAVRQGDVWELTTTLRNTSPGTPALMVRLKPVREKSGDRILPVIFSDNYVALMPGESRVIKMDIRQADTRGEAPRVEVEGFNVAVR